MNIVDSVLFQCRIHADYPAISVPGASYDPVTYAQLEIMLNNLTRALLPLGLQRGQIVGVLLQDKLLHVITLLALARLGLVTVSCRARALPKELHAVAVITDTSSSFGNVDRLILSDPEWLKGDGRQPEGYPFDSNGDELCRITLSSGSTGLPKAVGFTHRQLFQKNARLDYTRLDRWSRSSRLFCDLGLSSSLAFYYVLYMLMRGGMIMLSGHDPMSTLQSLNLYNIENMVTSPHGLSEYLQFFELQPQFHCNFDHILVAGSALRRPLAERTWARMCPNLITTYGAAETGAVASGDPRNMAEIPGAVGYILPGAAAEIIDHSGSPIRGNGEGVVRVRTEEAATCYIGDLETSSRLFRDGWFYPGDVGYLREDGILVITGREATLLNVGGDKINPEVIEEVLSSFPAIIDSAVVSVANALGIEQIHALVVTRGPYEESKLRAYCAQYLQRIFVPVRFIAVERIPRNEMAKIERSRLQELVSSSPV